ncbi:uncharacterized protein LOC124128501 isoform X2 [Haliotis rufescens]|uniref:uncharacterized protein LOC124128501 isoform X2 n=1 Tax=Haliotis rufescens TaxID=6454 RepID=UPI00201ED13A|nr:uncharacterized protein LOC124128501 isoform X2 [Haliotis rufescens]
MSESRLKEAKTFFTEGNKKSDAVIQVKDHELHVDLNIISLMSPTLASEFQPRPDPLSPPSETNKAVAKLDGRVDHIVDMLTSIYPNFRSVNVVDKDNVEYLLPLAAKYKLLFLMDTCETLIIGAAPGMNDSYHTCQIEITNEEYKHENKDRLMRYFVLAHKHELDVVRKCCMDKLVKCSYSIQTNHQTRRNPTRRTAAFQQLDPTTRWEILRNRLFYLEETRC